MKTEGHQNKTDFSARDKMKNKEIRKKNLKKGKQKLLEERRRL